jgi:hypothetical protein
MEYKFDEKKHAHKLDGKRLTGTSSIGDVLAKPGLKWWASGMALSEFGWTHPKKTKAKDRVKAAEKALEKLKKIEIHQYMKMLDDSYSAHNTRKKEAATDGTDLHKRLEKYVKSIIAGKEDAKDVPKQFVEWQKKNIKKWLYSEVNNFDKELYVGGVADAIAILNTGELALIDFKSASKVYDSMFIQLAGYVNNIEKNGLFDFDGVEIASPPKKKFDCMIVIPFGAEDIDNAIKIERRCKMYKDAFRAAVTLYRVMKNEFSDV